VALAGQPAPATSALARAIQSAAQETAPSRRFACRPAPPMAAPARVTSVVAPGTAPVARAWQPAPPTSLPAPAMQNAARGAASLRPAPPSPSVSSAGPLQIRMSEGQPPRAEGPGAGAVPSGAGAEEEL